MKYFGTTDGTDYGFYLEKDGLTSYVEVSDETWQSLIQQANDNQKAITADSDGNPTLTDLPEIELTDAEKIQNEIAELKAYLEQTDYIACKIAEGVATQEEYSEQLAQRAEARTKINELETQLEELSE